MFSRNIFAGNRTVDVRWKALRWFYHTNSNIAKFTSSITSNFPTVPSIKLNHFVRVSTSFDNNNLRTFHNYGKYYKLSPSTRGSNQLDRCPGFSRPRVYNYNTSNLNLSRQHSNLSKDSTTPPCPDSESKMEPGILKRTDAQETEHGVVGGGTIAGSSIQVQDVPAVEVALMKDARRIFQEGVQAVLPKEMVAKHLIMDADGNNVTVEGVTYPLRHNVYVTGFGKAVLGMARAVDDLIGGHIVRGVVSIPQGTQQEFKKAGKREMLLSPDSPTLVREGAANNMPDQPAHQAALEIAELVGSLGDGDLLVVLISGGGSALLPSPTPPLTLSDVLSVTGLMSRGGATITQLNTVRKQLNFLMGGGLATLAYPAQVVALILSDIVGDPIDLIASGPTVADKSSPEDCLSIFSSLDISDAVPETVLEFLQKKSEKVKKVEEKGCNCGGSGTSTSSIALSERECSELKHVHNLLIGSNKKACDRVCEKSSSLGYSPFVLSTRLEGEAGEVGKMFANLAMFVASRTSDLDGFGVIRKALISRYGLTSCQIDEVVSHVDKVKTETEGVCIVAGGETTVTVKGTGRGGRNQEMALSAGLELDKLFKEWHSIVENSKISTTDEINADIGSGHSSKPNTNTPNIVFLSAGTDGQDGPTPAAGGVVGLHFVKSAEGRGMIPQRYLDNNDSYGLFEGWSEGLGMVNTGLTGTNVMDIQLLLINWGGGSH